MRSGREPCTIATCSTDSQPGHALIGASQRRAVATVVESAEKARARSGSFAAASQSPQNGASAISMDTINCAAVASLRGFTDGT